MLPFKSTHLLIGLLLAVLTGWAGAQVPAAEAEALLRKSGLWKQLEGIEPGVQSGLDTGLKQGGAAPSAAEQARMKQAAAAAFDVGRLRATTLRVVSTGLDPKLSPALARWYDAEPGRTITALEEAASADNATPQQTMQEGNVLLEAMPSPRRALLNEIVEVTHAGEAGARAVINTALAIHRGVSSARPGTVGTEAEMKAQLQAQRPQLVAALSALAKAAMAKIYATVPTAELLQYAAFLKSDAGRAFTDLCTQAQEAAFTEASEELGRQLPATQDKSKT